MVRQVRRRNAGNQRTMPVREVVRAAQGRDHGYKIVPHLRPPQIVRLPWNSYTFSATYALSASSNKVEITVGNIRQQIASRMGIGSESNISLKVNTAYAWNTSVGPAFVQPSMESLFWELTTDSGGSYQVRSEQYDHGTLNIPARGGYLYPLADRKEVQTSANDTHVIAQFVTPAVTSNVTVRCHVLWNASAIPTRSDLDQNVETHSLVDEIPPLPRTLVMPANRTEQGTVLDWSEEEDAPLVMTSGQ